MRSLLQSLERQKAGVSITAKGKFPGNQMFSISFDGDSKDRFDNI